MICPFCKNELISGNIFCDRAMGVAWLPDNMKMPRLQWQHDAPRERGGFWLIPRYQKGILCIEPGSLPVHFCRHCDKLIADLPNSQKSG